jgi:hypothetical protein
MAKVLPSSNLKMGSSDLLATTDMTASITNHHTIILAEIAS